jgi:2-polyprenyl-3-methyl-5-hydroxy-6-metoxy-1,4-benzoquinol methylase
MSILGKCHLCCSLLSNVVSKRDAKTGEALAICLCEGCGLVQQSPIPADHELRIYYSHHYRADYKNTYSPKPKYIYRAGRAAHNRIAFLTEYLEANGQRAVGLSMLDIGAGGGEVVFAATQAGFHAKGIEPNEGYSAFARDNYGIEVSTAHLDDIANERFSVITMFHVLEHMPSPRKVFRRLHELLEPDGLLVVEVPNIEQADASPANIFFKAHLYYYSASTLVYAAAEAFEPVLLEHTGNIRAIFKRRPTLIDASRPSAEDIEHTRKRLQEKGWTEYLLKGGGWKRPFQRIANRLREETSASNTPLITLKRALKAL